MSKALLFNHHPEHLWEYKRSLEAIGIEPFFATEELAFKYGATYYSINSELKWRRGPKWFDSKELFEDTFKYSSSEQGFDYIFTMNREIANNISFDAKRLFFIAPVSWDLLNMNNSKKYTKITAHPMGDKFGAKYIPRFVQMYGEQKNKKYITQLMENYTNSVFYKELLQLKTTNDVIIAGSDTAPDGIVFDWEILSQTSMLVHHKNYGVVCTAVLKALDCGIPIYTTKENRIQMGFTELPDFCFIFADDMNIKQAYEYSKTVDNKLIQKTYRYIFNLNNTANRVKELIQGSIQ
jgi:hypothetical protein